MQRSPKRSYSKTQVQRLIDEAMAPLLARIAGLEKRVVSLEAENLRLRDENAALTSANAALTVENARLKTNSSNSSKPPSSDIVKPPKDPDSKGGPTGGGQIGGQPGHAKHERLVLPPGRVDEVKEYRPASCPDCGGQVLASRSKPKVLQQIELAGRPLIVTEHKAFGVWCPHCQKTHPGTLPPEVLKAGLLGPRLTALAGWFKSRGHDSYSTLAEFMEDVGGLKVSRGLLAKAIQKVSGALAQPYEELAAALPQEKQLNVDETGHPENGKLHWTWVFRARRFTVFDIDPSRGSAVLRRILGEQFQGVLGCDYFSAYRKYMGELAVLVQFCLAHLIRDVRFLATLPDAPTKRWAGQMLCGFRRLFGVIHRRAKLTEAGFQRSLVQARDALLARGKRGPMRGEVQNLVTRLQEHGAAYFRFVTTPGIEPTNNVAEQALRCVVIDRRLTQGTRSARGRDWCQRIWTAAATCRQQGRSLYAYLCVAVESNFAGRPAPSLMPVGV